MSDAKPPEPSRERIQRVAHPDDSMKRMIEVERSAKLFAHAAGPPDAMRRTMESIDAMKLQDTASAKLSSQVAGPADAMRRAMESINAMKLQEVASAKLFAQVAGPTDATRRAMESINAAKLQASANAKLFSQAAWPTNAIRQAMQSITSAAKLQQSASASAKLVAQAAGSTNAIRQAMESITSTAKLQESMSAKLFAQAVGPTNAMRQAMQSIASAMKLQESASAKLFSQATWPTNAIRQAMESITSASKLREGASAKLFAQAAGPTNAIRQAMESIASTAKLQESMSAKLFAQAVGPTNAMRQAMESISAIKLQDAVSSRLLANPEVFALANSLKGWATDLDEFASDAPEEDRLEEGDLQLATTVVNDLATKADLLDVSARVQLIVDEIRRQQNPTVRMILVHQLWELLRNVAYNVLATVIVLLFLSPAPPAPIIHTRHTIVVREVQRDAKALLQDNADLKKYRVVLRPNVRARQGPSDRAAIQGNLNAGHVVLVIEKRKKWVLVRWSVDVDSTQEGWIRSKNLAPLHR